MKNNNEDDDDDRYLIEIELINWTPYVILAVLGIIGLIVLAVF